MKFLKTVAVAVFLFAAFILFSNFECWIQPSGYQFEKGQSCAIHFIHGNNFQGRAWDLRKGDITRLDFYSLAGHQSLMPLLAEGPKDNLTIPMTVEGTSLLVAQDLRQQEFMSQEGFAKAMDDSGLKMPEISDDSIPVLVTRCEKLMLQVGAVSGSTFRNAVDLPLEIVPINNPYLLKPGENMNFRLLLNGKPLEFTPVTVWNRKGERVLVQNIYTQKDGTMNTPLSNEGSWMVTAAKMVKSTEPGVAWQRYETSLQFGFGKD